MSPQEFWTLADELKPPEMIGNVRKDVVEDLIAELHRGEKEEAHAELG